MTSEGDEDVIAQYRAASRERPRKALDDEILRAASIAMKRRTPLAPLYLIAGAAAAAMTVWVGANLWQAPAHVPVFDPTECDVHPARCRAAVEGRSLAFLLRQSDSMSVGPGSTSFTRVWEPTTEN